MMKRLLLVLPVACLLISSCGNSKQETNTQEVVTEDTTKKEQPTTEGEEEVSRTLPSPLQIASIFKRSGLKYQEGLICPENNADKFSTSFMQAIGLGIYSADLSYCVLNKQKQPAINCMKTVRKLADKLGMGSVFDNNNIAKRFEANIDKQDSLGAILPELQMESDMFLEDNEKQHVSAIVFSGAWVESMYIGGKLYEKEKEKKLLSKLVEQMNIMESIVAVLKTFEAKDNNITTIINDFSTIKSIYENFASVKNAATTDKGEKDILITEEEGITLSKKIEELRNRYIKG